MTTHLRRLAVIGCAVALASIATLAQMRVAPLDMGQGHVALGLALRHLGTSGIFMQATAHPDDENNRLLVMLNRGQGYRTVLATATRGSGGQNQLGSELFEALGVLRTEELAAMHRFDGAEQYFTRAVDFGYSFSAEETFGKWGRDEIIGDFVRLVRLVRPDVILALRPDGTRGGQHHQASAILAREVFTLAGDSSKYPDQLNAGLRAWRPKKLYFAGRFGGSAAQNNLEAALALDLSRYDPLLGRTYAEIGAEARSMHKSQGMAQLLALPGPSVSTFQLAESTIPDQMGRQEQTLFDGIDTSLVGLAQFAGPRPPKALTRGLSAIRSAVHRAQRAFETESDAATLQPLLAGLRDIRALRAQLRPMTIDENGRFEIDFRLRQKEREFQQAILLAGAVRVDALADDGVVVPGQRVQLLVSVANRGEADLLVKQVKIEGFGSNAGCALALVTEDRARSQGGGRGGAVPASSSGASTLESDQVARCEPTLTVPATLQPSEPYWRREGEAGRYTLDENAPVGLPHRLTPFYVQATLNFAGSTEDVFSGTLVEYRYEGDFFGGEKRSEMLVVPPLSVGVSPAIAIVPISVPPEATGSRASLARRVARGAAASREIDVTLLNSAKGAAKSVVTLELPNGWTASPEQQTVAFSREDESRTVRFQLTVPASTVPGEYAVRAAATRANGIFSRGYQVIDYPHIRRQHLYQEAASRVKVIDVRTAPDLTVGYIMGVGDEVPAALAQLGVRVEMLAAEDLASGDLSRFSTIVTGVRAYERRADLRSNNSRLMDYVRAGGTLVVQYNRFPFNDAQYGPYPAKVSASRVTAEDAPVTVLAPADPLFNTPNRITDAAWQGWVQERGLYFLDGERDSRYRDLVELEDLFPNNPGKKRGALVAANYGKGRWIYVGLGLWRELTAGVDGAYQLLANLINPR